MSDLTNAVWHGNGWHGWIAESGAHRIELSEGAPAGAEIEAQRCLREVAEYRRLGIKLVFG